MNTENPETNSGNITSVSEIKRKSLERNKEELITLPSGFTVKVRKLDIIRLMEEGYFPASLMQAAIKSNKEEGNANSADSLKLMKNVVIKAFISPEMVEKDPTDNQIGYYDLEIGDRQKVFEYAIGDQSEPLEDFRKKKQVTPKSN